MVVIKSSGLGVIEAGTISEKDLDLFHISNDKNDTFKYVTSFIE